jgi:hypothetical protein
MNNFCHVGSYSGFKEASFNPGLGGNVVILVLVFRAYARALLGFYILGTDLDESRSELLRFV